MRPKDSQFSKRRNILGLRVLLNCPPDTDGIVPATFTARIKRPDGDVDLRIIAHYYWQAFSAAKDWIIKHPAA